MTLTKLLLAVGLSIILTGCVGSDQEELHTWMLEQRSQVRPRVTPIPAPKQFRPESYAEAGSVEPFSKEKLASVLKRDVVQARSTTSALIAPELARRKESLEAFPLDAMVMVGSLIREGQPAALIKVDNLLYQVRLGNHLGMNYGRVTKITETEVTLREIAQDAVGEWIERTATLQLQEKSK